MTRHHAHHKTPREGGRGTPLTFELGFEHGVSNAYHGSEQDIWDWYIRGFGPLRQLAETLPADRLEWLRRDVDAYHRHYVMAAGLHVKREYLLIMGRRR